MLVEQIAEYLVNRHHFTQLRWHMMVSDKVKRQWLAGLHPWWTSGSFTSSPATERCLANLG